MKPHYYKPYLYAAYGSNLHEKQMLARCPRAERVSTTVLPDYRLVFRGVADIEPCEGSEVPIGLWQITGHCEAALDRYEGYPNLYGKVTMPIPNTNGFRDMMFYQMKDRHTVYPPADFYLDSLIQGYKDWNISPDYLKEAVRDSFTRETA